jgi:hypothetical protein
MSNYITFSFELDQRAMTHLKDKSHYDHNYYKLDLSVYGDYITPEKCDILYEEYDEFSDTYTYTLGYFENTEHGINFIKCFTWTDTNTIGIIAGGIEA